METNGPIDHHEAKPGLVLTNKAQSYLRDAGKWAYFLSVLGFIACAILFIVALFAGSFYSRMAELSSSPKLASTFAGLGHYISLIYILIDVFYFFFVRYLYQFANNIKKGILLSDSNQLAIGLEKLKSFFKLWGITTIVVLILYALIIIAVVLLGVGMMHH